MQIRVPKTLAFKTRLRANLSCENDPFYLHENSLSLALKRPETGVKLVFGLFDTGYSKDERIQFSNNEFINGTYEA